MPISIMPTSIVPDVYDVVIVGYGPTGMLAAVKLGQAGHRVAIVERHRDLYKLARVGIVHDDVLRMFQELGISDAIAPATFFLPKYELSNKGRILLSNEVQAKATHGWPEFISIYQPAFEAELDRIARTLPADVLQGMKAVALAQDDETVTVTLEDAHGERRNIAGRYLVGADGGNSFVRQALRIDVEFLGFDQDWLVIDGKAKKPPRPDLPLLRQLCEPDQPGMTMQMGAHHRRWSMMVLPGESHEEAVSHASVWRRLDRPEGATPDEFELVRVVIYKFTSQIATRWRAGRVFLAGDAAHLMPPFLAQGLCTGLRDAYNLAWKLDAVLKGQAGAPLLDTYEAERAPNARATIIESARVGQNVIERDHDKARERDARLAAMQAELERAKGQKALIGFRVPGYQQGFRAARAKAAGDSFPQGDVRGRAGAGRFDDVAGRGWTIVARNGDAAAALPAADRAYWESLGGGFVTLGQGGVEGAVEDSEGVYTRLMDEYGCDAIVKRPDYYIFGACPTLADLPGVIAELKRQMAA